MVWKQRKIFFLMKRNQVKKAKKSSSAIRAEMNTKLSVSVKKRFRKT